MAVTTIARIQHRRGLRTDLPANLYEGELGFCLDTKELFIGNSLAEGGNTQVLTTSTNIGDVARYTFRSSTQVASVTGASASQPTTRSLQYQIDDYWVNVKAYGAMGNGIDDDTAAINRAIQDLYTKILTVGESEFQTKKAIWFPSGIYRITSPLLVYPRVRLVGESKISVKITLDTTDPHEALFLLADGQGNTGTSIGDNGAELPSFIQVENIWFSAPNDHTLMILYRCANSIFRDCTLEGSWLPGDPANLQKGVLVDPLGTAVMSENIRFQNCTITNVSLAYYCTDEVYHVSFESCLFYQCFKGILLEQRLAPDPIPGNGPYYTRVVNSRFQDIDDYGIQVMSPNPGVTSMCNLFLNVGFTSVLPPVYWDTVSTVNSSIADVFDNLPGVSNQGTSNQTLNVP